MKTETVIDRGPAVRCYECGSTEIISLCHHCARPMCAAHCSNAFQASGAGVDGSAQPASKEFGWLKQSDPRRGAVYHCGEHDHKVGLLKLVLERLGIGRSAGQAPPLPVFPHVNTVEIVERLSGQVNFSNGRYRSTVDGPVSGEITVDMSANSGQEWLTRYRKKYQLHGDEPIAFTAGYAFVQGAAGLRFAPGQEMVLEDGTGVAFRGGSASGHPLFDDVPGHPPGEWISSTAYRVQAGNAPEDIPLWIVPSVVPSSDRKTLEIDLHWNDLGPEGKELNLARFDLIELEVPTAWGSVQPAPGGATINPGRQGRRLIRWMKLPPRGRDDSGGPPRAAASSSGARSRTLILRFENAVLPGNDGGEAAETADAQLSGTLTAIFEQRPPRNGALAAGAGTLSGVRGVDIYLPGGGKARQQPDVRVRTEVTVKFGISLDAIRYQEPWAVPRQSNARYERDLAEGRHGDGGQEVPGSENGYRKADEPFYGVVPDFDMVAELTSLISREGYYVKSVVEQDPQPGYESGGEIIKRVWDIAGRWYYGVFPIGFVVSLRGEEFANDARLPGKTTAVVTVNGTYGNDPGLTQRAMIEKCWDDLHEHVTSVLRRRAAGVGAASIPAAPESEAWDEDITIRDIDEPEQEGSPGSGLPHDPIVVDAEIVDEQPVAAPAGSGNGEDKQARIAALRQQWEDTDTAVISGRITEQTHARIVARIQDQLRELGEQP